MSVKHQCPSWLSSTAKQYWKKLAPLVNLDDVSTREQLCILADSYAQYRTASNILNNEGLTITTKTTTKAHPAVAIKAIAASQIDRLTKVLFDSTTDQPSTDELDRFLG